LSSGPWSPRHPLDRTNVLFCYDFNIEICGFQSVKSGEFPPVNCRLRQNSRLCDKLSAHEAHQRRARRRESPAEAKQSPLSVVASEAKQSLMCSLNNSKITLRTSHKTNPNTSGQKSMRDYFVYILTNKNNTVLYTGVTNNLFLRVQQHKSGKGGKFTAKYKVTKLIYYEVFDNAYDALNREKQIKAGSRQKKIDLINENNPAWFDLFDELQF
jgi:putative endonuclease